MERNLYIYYLFIHLFYFILFYFILFYFILLYLFIYLFIFYSFFFLGGGGGEGGLCCLDPMSKIGAFIEEVSPPAKSELSELVINENINMSPHVMKVSK